MQASVDVICTIFRSGSEERRISAESVLSTLFWLQVQVRREEGSQRLRESCWWCRGLREQSHSAVMADERTAGQTKNRALRCCAIKPQW